MLRPVCDWSGRRGALARLLVVAAAALASGTAAHAEASVQAASGLSAKLTAAAQRPLPPPAEHKLAENRSTAFGPEQRAEELYLDAFEQLEDGRDASARSTFEALIARFPQSTAAARARRQLGTLQSRNPAPPLDAAAAETAVGAGPAWEQELRRNAPIQTRLRGEAGDRVFFSAGSAELGGRARAALSAQAQWLNRWHEFEAAIEGHADEPGSEEENLKLSEARAEAVRRRLVEEGVEASRLAIVAQGRAQRIAICVELDCAAQNRRAVTLVFVSGARDRLGLTPPRLEAADRPHARPRLPAAAGTVETPAVGVAR
jgi:peptidoglycan-associated lipoprotein